MERNNLEDISDSEHILNIENSEEEYTPKLFSDDHSYQTDEATETNEINNNGSEHLFDQDTNEEEDFEIPAFLRKQKF